MRRFLWIVLVAIVALTMLGRSKNGRVGQAEVDYRQIQNIAELYRKAINSGNFDILKPYLSRNFKFGNNPTDVSLIVVPAVFNAHIMTINKINSISAKEIQDTVLLIMDLDVVAMGNVLKTEDKMVLIYEDNNLRILSLGEGTLQTMVIKDPVKDLTFDISGADFTKLNFIDNPTHILIPATLGKEQDTTFYFILDSGAPMTIINSPYAAMFEPIEQTGKMLGEARGVGGEINIDRDFRTIPQLTLGDITLSGIKALSINLTHLERALGQEFIGLIGVDVIGKFITTINYRNRELYLAKSVDDMQEFLDDEVVQRIDFEQKLHLMTILAQLPLDTSIHIGDSSIKVVRDIDTDKTSMLVRLALDSGAGVGLLSMDVLDLVPEENIQLGSTDTLIGAGLAYQLAQVRYIDGLSISSITRDDYPIFEGDISHLSMSKHAIIDGLIGLNFFDNYLITLNYQTKTIELRELPEKGVRR